MRLLVPEVGQYPYVFLGGFIVLMGIAGAKDFAFYKEFFSLKTTRHGLNMGTLILLVIALLGGINFVAHKRDKKWDVTEEKLNSVSEQTEKIAKSLNSELSVKGFFTENNAEEAAGEQRFKALLKLYEEENSLIKSQTINPVKRPDLAQQFNVQTAGTIVLEYKGKKSTLNDVSEEALTNAIVKITRDRNKVIYFMTGHGELDLDENRESGASDFKRALEDSSYEVKKFNFVEAKAIPGDAEVLAVLGPSQPLLKPEMDALFEFAKKGGKLLLAADPDKNHNLGELTEKLGVHLKKNYIVDQVGQLVGASGAMAIGMSYSTSSDITKSFKGNMMTGFFISSSVKKDEKAPSTLRYDEIVKSSPGSFSKQSLSSGEVKFNKETDEQGPLAIGITVQGTLGDGADKKEFSAAIFGDSDFFSNQVFKFQLNKDLAVNSAAFLAKDSELISIRPKVAKGTQLAITDTQAKLLLFGFLIPLPIVFFGTGVTTWLRRRNA